ncbi:MAG: (Fe-S)-binding protein [Chloroflexota bacterium]
MSLAEVKEWLYACMRCSTCKEVKNLFVPSCPAGEMYQLESYFPSGKLLIGKAIYEGKLDLADDDIRDRIYACTGCLSCEQQCGVYHHEHIFETIQAIRTEAVTQGYLNPAYMVMIDSLKKDDNVLGKPKAERGDWAKGMEVKDANHDKAEVLYRAGCMLSYDPELRDVPRSALEIIKAAGVDVGITGGEETCCGNRAYETGYLGEFTKYAEHCLETYNNMGVSKLVTSCSDGYSSLKNLYSKINIKMKFEVLHMVEYIEQLLNEGRITFARKVPMKVTYHDPCHLGRHMSNGMYEPPRNILSSIHGIELVEMERNRENSWCCGAGGGVKQAFPDFALWTAGERLKEAKDTGATALITSCPWCERNFKDVKKEYGEDIEVYDIAEITLKAMQK